MRGLVTDVPSPHSMLGVLPGVYAEDELARRLVSAFDDGLAPIFVTLDNFACYLDPALTPPDFLGWLARWVVSVDDPELAEERRRVLVGRAVELHARRCTKGGLADLVELVTGVAPEIEESGGTAWSAEPGAAPPGESTPEVLVRLRVPDPERIDARSLDALVAAVRPAHVPYRVEVISRPSSTGGSP